MRKLTLSLLLWLLALALNLQAAQKYALLIGIGQYIPGQRLPNLEGPNSDVDAVLATITKDYGFVKENVTVLRDAEASRAGILAALDQLIKKVAAGDYVLIYYSGHGTSPQDASSRDLPIDGDTGAIIPADYKLGTAREMAERLVVGRRDLRPRLMQLDKKATVLGILDTCFSANLMKSVKLRGAPRGVPASQLVAGRTKSMEDDIRDDVTRMKAAPPPSPYPYHSIAWISAALAGQQAVDLDSNSLRDDPKATVDGHPHGQFTNAVLAGLSGSADRNHDGTISQEEMYQYVQQLSVTWSHQPVWSAEEGNREIGATPILGGRLKALAENQAPRVPNTLGVSLEGDAGALRDRLSRISGLSLTSVQPDLVVRAETGGYRLYQSGGVPINEAPLDAPDAVARVIAEADVQRLVGWHPPRQRLSLELAPYQDGQPSKRGLFFADQSFDLMLSDSMTVFPLVVDVDVTGQVTVLYPRKKMTDSISPGRPQNLGNNTVSCPCGIDLVKAVAFDRKPAGYDNWAGQSFAATDPRLRQMVGQMAAGVAETTLRVISSKR